MAVTEIPHSYGGGLDVKPKTSPCIYTSNTVSSLYFMNFFADMYAGAKELAADFKKKRLLPITSGLLKVFSSTLNFLYSIGSVLELAMETHHLALPFLKILSPLIALSYTALEVGRDFLHLTHLSKIRNEITQTLSVSDNIEKTNLLEEKIEKDPHFKKILGTKISVILMDHINAFRLNGDTKSLEEATSLIQKQFYKANLIYSISLACLATSGVSILLGMFLAPPFVVISFGLIATAISLIRNMSLPGYLYQPGHKFVMKDALPNWLKNPTSTIVDTCGKISSKWREFWTRRPVFFKKSAHLQLRDFSPSSSNQKYTPLFSSHAYSIQNSKTKKSAKRRSPHCGSTRFYMELSVL